jgi:hypothetical protein
VNDPKAWSFVLQWAEDKITFPTLSDMMTDTFRDQYVPSEWKLIFNRVFTLSEDDDTGLAVAFILEEMDSRGVASSSGSVVQSYHQSRPQAMAKGRQLVVQRNSGPRNENASPPIVSLTLKRRMTVRKSAQKEGKGKKTVRPLALSHFLINSFSVGIPTSSTSTHEGLWPKTLLSGSPHRGLDALLQLIFQYQHYFHRFWSACADQSPLSSPGLACSAP